MKRTIEVEILRDDMQAFLEAAKSMEMETTIIPGQDKSSDQVKFKVRYTNPADCYRLGMAFESVKENSDPVI